MALQKDIRGENGITTNYHRVSALTLTTNRQNSIIVLSYVDNKSRIYEKDGGTQPYIEGKTYEVPYDELMTIEKAYAFLKTLPEYVDSVDV